MSKDVRCSIPPNDDQLLNSLQDSMPRTLEEVLAGLDPGREPSHSSLYILLDISIDSQQVLGTCTYQYGACMPTVAFGACQDLAIRGDGVLGSYGS